MKKWIVLLVCAVLMMSLMACAGSAVTTTEKFDIVVVPRAAETSDAAEMEQGVLAYAKAHPEVNVYLQGVERFDALKQSQLVEDLVAQRVDAICVVPIDVQLLEPVIAKAREVGVVVIACEGAELMHVNYDIEVPSDADPAATAKAMITLAVKVLQQEAITAPVNLGEPGFEMLSFREDSTIILEGAN